MCYYLLTVKFSCPSKLRLMMIDHESGGWGCCATYLATTYLATAITTVTMTNAVRHRNTIFVMLYQWHFNRTVILMKNSFLSQSILAQYTFKKYPFELARYFILFLDYFIFSEF